MSVKYDFEFRAKMMELALNMAKRAFARGEVPVGAVIVNSSGEVIARASNRIESMGCQLGHAEASAVKAACKKKGDWRLDGCTMFVTLQPCMMCIGLAYLSRISCIEYGASSPLFGFDAVGMNLGNAYRGLKIVPGLKQSDCADILSRFFGLVRSKNKIKM